MTAITFVNSSSRAVHVYWVDYLGVEQFWFELKPGLSQKQDTYVTHAWCVREKTSNEALLAVIAEKEELIATITSAASEVTRVITPVPSAVDITLTPAATPLTITSPEVIQWDETTSLPIASSSPFNNARGQQLIFHNGYVYIFGGSSAGNDRLTNVYFSSIEPDGTLATWRETTSLPNRYYDHVVVKVGNTVYLLTGAAGSRDVAYAPLNADGSVGDWIGTTPLDPSRQQFAAASYGNFIYATGGNSGGNQSFVQYTSAKPNGSLNNWSFTIPLPAKIQAHTMLAYNGYLYVFGGKNANDEWVTTVYNSAIQPDGTLAAWRTTSALPVTMASYNTFESNGYIYLIGGSSSSSYYARVMDNHDLDNWEKITSLPNTKIHGLRTGAYNGFAYAVGGYKNGFQRSVYYGFIGLQRPPESPTPAVSATLTPGPLSCQLEINQNIHVLDGTNLWSQPDVVNGSMMGTLPAGTSAYVINGPAWGRIVETGVAGWWWEISTEANGASAGWIWEGRIEECSTLNGLPSGTPTPASYPTPTRTLTPLPSPTHTNTPIATALPDCTAGWSQLTTGISAVVTGDAGDPPNRVRAEPNANAEIIVLIYPSHQVLVLEGPICADGLVFWKVESDAIPSGAGWTAEGDGTDYWLEPNAP